MRFQTFEFQQYAGFEKRSLKFDETKRLHIILGDNEAGKSRLLRAFGRFFFGFPQRGDPDQFGVIGSKSKLLANVTLDGKTGAFERSRSKSAPFVSLDPSLRIEDLQSQLGGLNEQQFLNLHALSHDELRQGGVDLMGGKGTLGKSLFAAGAGLLPLQKKVAAYKDAAEKLYLPRANAKKEINLLLAERAALQEQLKDSEFNQQKYADLSGRISRAETLEAETRAESDTQRQALGKVRTASELRGALDGNARELNELEAQHSTKHEELHTQLKSLGLSEAWLKDVSPSLLPVILEMSKKLSDASLELDAVVTSMGAAPVVSESIAQLNVGELTDLPDIEHQQSQVLRLESQATEGRSKASLIAEQLDLPDLTHVETPMSHELRDLQDKMRDLIQEKRSFDKIAEGVEAELRELNNRQQRLKQSAQGIDGVHFGQQIKRRDQALREAINLLVAKDSVKAVEKITEAQTLIDTLDELSEQRVLNADAVAEINSNDESVFAIQAKQSALMEEHAELLNRKSVIGGEWSEKWSALRLSEVSMRDYAEWQKQADKLDELKRQLKNIDFERVELQSVLEGSEKRVADLFLRWQSALGFEEQSLTIAEKRQQLNAWATEVQSKQAALRSFGALQAQAEKLTIHQSGAFETLNTELKLAGVQQQSSAATTIRFVAQFESLFQLNATVDGLTAKSENRQVSVAEMKHKLAHLGIEDFGDGVVMQELADAAKDEHARAEHELAALNAELEQNWRSNDPLILESQIKVLEEKIKQKAYVFKLNKAAAHVLDIGLESFVRQQGQDLLSKASSHIHALTNGRYQEIRVEGVDDESYWTLVDTKGEEVPSTGLSDGTRDQLFLSMRLSFLCESKLPFIADDLFVNFDDRRSEAAFTRLESALPDSQLFYFTHHRHLAEVATRALGKENVELVELS